MLTLANKFLSFLDRFSIDWILFFAILPLLGAGLVTMHSFAGDSPYFPRQIIWIAVSLGVFFAASFIDWRFLRRTRTVLLIYFTAVAALLLLFIVGSVFFGAQSWFNLGFFAIQPSELAKLALIILLAKYFSRRHVEIAHPRHILISGAYAFILFALVLVQPDFGSALIIFAIWFGMVLVSGISKKHLLLLALLGTVSFAMLWMFVFTDVQRARITTFLNPTSDLQGDGWSAFQSMVAVGSGQILGKGVGYGTQSRLQFLPVYQTDFVFAAFAEEWGFIGVSIVFILFAIIIWRILLISLKGQTNFETLFGLGVATLFIAHFTVHVGMNIGLLPITGITIPFMSYGGSHLLTEFLALGILMGMRRYELAAHREDLEREFLGPV